MKKLTALALLASVPLGAAALLRSRRARQTPGEKRWNAFRRMSRRFRHQAGELGESVRAAMPDLPVIGQKT